MGNLTLVCTIFLHLTLGLKMLINKDNSFTEVNVEFDK